MIFDPSWQCLIFSSHSSSKPAGLSNCSLSFAALYWHEWQTDSDRTSSRWWLVLAAHFSLITAQSGLTRVTSGSAHSVAAAHWIDMFVNRFIQWADQEVVDQQQFVTLSPPFKDLQSFHWRLLWSSQSANKRSTDLFNYFLCLIVTTREVKPARSVFSRKIWPSGRQWPSVQWRLLGVSLALPLHTVYVPHAAEVNCWCSGRKQQSWWRINFHHL